MKDHLHKCRDCDLLFTCYCEDRESIFGDCPKCAAGGISLVGALLILAGVAAWVLAIRALLAH